MQNSKVTAIVPSYNEQARIGNVLPSLLATPSISEVIVIDDGSTDGTAGYIAQNFPTVKLIVNQTNQGKALSMDHGVVNATNDIIFFCDADLVDFTPSVIEDILNPVIKGEYDMFIGIRNNKMQKSFMPFGRNSGERVMHKQIWQKLPIFYKHRFRIEVGLNLMVHYCTDKGTGYKVLPYYQTLKEDKYGFWKGETQRWKMNFDVAIGWLRAVYDFYFLCHILGRPLK